MIIAADACTSAWSTAFDLACCSSVLKFESANAPCFFEQGRRQRCRPIQASAAASRASAVQERSKAGIDGPSQLQQSSQNNPQILEGAVESSTLYLKHETGPSQAENLAQL